MDFYLRFKRVYPFIKRYNMTIQEEFIENDLDIIFDKRLFKKRLA